MERHFFHSGDLGDIIYSLPTIRALGGGSLVIGPSAAWTSATPYEVMLENLRPLLESQFYLEEINYSQNADQGLIDLNQFRTYFDHHVRHRRNLNIADYHLTTFRQVREQRDRKWLNVEPRSISGKPVILNRSSRWGNSRFPWVEVLEKYSDRSAFVGTASEHESFRNEFGHVEYLHTPNLLNLAEVIAGAKLFIGNQSCAYAIAEGLKQNTIQESWPDDPNCIFARENAKYILEGTIELPDI